MRTRKNIVFIGEGSAYSASFDGRDLIEPLSKKGWNATFMPLLNHEPASDGPVRWNAVLRFVRKCIASIEHFLGLQSLLYPFVIALFLKRKLYKADIIHIQNISNQAFSILAIPLLSCIAPVVISLHDFWFTTGHCIHPLDCTLYQSSCHRCPYPNRTIAIRRRTTMMMASIKSYILNTFCTRLIVPSLWMKTKLLDFPNLDCRKVTVIPNSVNPDRFHPMNKENVRKELGIPEAFSVLGFRLQDSSDDWKGNCCIFKALALLPNKGNYFIVTCGEQHCTNPALMRYPHVNMGMIRQPAEMARFYNALDLFLMPSKAESFGLMCLESIFCGTPVVYHAGTAMDSLLGPFAYPWVCPPDDAASLATVIESFFASSGQFLDSFNAKRQEWINAYRTDSMVNSLIHLYSMVLDTESDNG